MKIIKKLIATMLAVLMLSSCVSCGNETVSTDTSADTSAPAPDEQKESERDIALAAFGEKAQALNAMTDRKSDVTVKFEKKTGDASYGEEYEYSFEYSGIGSDAFIAQVNTKAVLEKTVIRATETFSEGAAVYEIDGDGMYYITEMKAEDYIGRHIPAVIFDPEVYNTVEYDAESGVFTFSDAQSVEAWAAPEYAKVVSASGKATVTDGAISLMTYEAEYVQGPVSVKASYEVKVGGGTLTADTLAKPASEKKVATDNIDIPMSIRYAYDMLEAGFGVDGTCSNFIYSYAAGAEMTHVIKFAHRGAGKDAVGILSEQVSVQDSRGGSSKSEYELIYRDGSATYSEDGAEPEKIDYSWERLLKAIKEENEYNLIDRCDMFNLTSEHLTDFMTVNFELPENYGNIIEDSVSDSMFGDKDYLDSFATEYKTDSLKAYLSIDKDTGFIVASGVEYTGNHTIEGQQCPLVYSSSSLCKTASPSAYTTVTGDPVPDVEPEKKPTPAFYVITSAEGKKMYLLGTIHIGDDRTAYLPDEITDALASSDALALEINSDDIEQRIEDDKDMMAAYLEGMMYRDGSSNKTKLSEEAYKGFKQISRLLGDVVYTEMMLPSVVASQYEYYLLESGNQLWSSKGVEERLIKIAKDKGVEIIEVEEIIGRLKLDSRYSAMTQLYILDSAVTAPRAEICADAMELYEAWCSGDEARIRELNDESPIDEDAEDEEKFAYAEYERILMTERDAQMIEKAKEYLASDKTVFMAVGAAHVLRDGGLIDALEEAGYTVEKVEYK